MPSSSADDDSTTSAETAALIDNKKVATKGALKVFEGLKVSIPTEDLDLTQVLGKKPILLNEASGQSIEEPKLQPEPISNLNNDTDEKKLDGETKTVKLKITKSIKISKNGLKKLADSFTNKMTQKATEDQKEKLENDKETKGYDVYDFEETQDNSDVFFVNPLSNYRNFRNQAETGEKIEPKTVKETEASNFTDSYSFEAASASSASTVSNLSPKKNNVDKNITKKKCMIMGRIFKNALKSKVDDDIREIPEANNDELVSDYVLKCPPPTKTPKGTMTQEEMDRLFNNLLEDRQQISEKHGTNGDVKNVSKSEVVKVTSSKQKTLKSVKCRKRCRNNSESTDDEFSIPKPTKKRTCKKGDKKADNSINLEQELKECIGVASRKSQRKCTSGKQNVLVEFWSSDESMSEAVLETRLPSDQSELHTVEESPKQVQEEIIAPLTDIICSVETQKEAVQKKQKKQQQRNRPKPKVKETQKPNPAHPVPETLASNRRKRASVNTLYYWSSSSEDEFQDLIELKSVRNDFHDDDEDRPVHHGWIVGDSPKKLVTMLAQAKGKKSDLDCVKEQAKNRTSIMCS